MIWWGTSTVVNLIGLLPDATGLLERWVVVRGGFCCSLNAEWESLPSSSFTFAPPPPQLGSSYIISRLWCYIKDAWLSCCLTQRGPPVWVELLLERGPNTQTRTDTHVIVWMRSSSLKAEICYLTDGCGRLSLRLNAPERDTESRLAGQR